MEKHMQQYKTDTKIATDFTKKQRASHQRNSTKETTMKEKGRGGGGGIARWHSNWWMFNIDSAEEQSLSVTCQALCVWVWVGQKQQGGFGRGG